MKTPRQLPPKPRFLDPRTRKRFDPRFLPAANGRPLPPPGALTGNARVALEFAAAYYAVNCEHDRLRRIRATPESPSRGTAERRQLVRVERVLRRRDGLEDYYAPFGVIAEPVMRDGFALDLQFTFGSVNALGALRSEGYVLSAYVPIPLPSDFKLEDYLVAPSQPPWLDATRASGSNGSTPGAPPSTA